MSSTFIEKFKLYKSLKKTDHKQNELLVFLDLLIIISPTIILMNLLFNNYVTDVMGDFGVPVVVLISFINLISIPTVYNEEESKLNIGLLHLIFDKIMKTELYIKSKTFTGSLSEIFDMNCEITRKVLKDNKEMIEKELYTLKAIKGETLISLWNDILHEKKEQENKLNQDEEIKVLINCNTKIGKAFQELNRLDEASIPKLS